MIYFIFLLHFIGNFLLQIPWFEKNKSNLSLLAQGMIYGSVMWLGLSFFMIPSVPTQIFYLFILFNLLTNILINAATSELKEFLWIRHQKYLLSLALGLDQLAHFTTLLLSYQVFFESSIGKQWLIG